MKRLINVVVISIVLMPGIFQLSVFAQNDPMKNIKVGANYLVWEAEATDSPLGNWKIITPADSIYFDEGEVSPINNTHLEFTGNNHNSGPADSPLDYTFTCPKTGTYRLGARLYQRLIGLPEDKCNDVYVRMKGDFTSANDVPLEELRKDHKFYGRGPESWGSLFKLEIHGVGHRFAEYNLKEGEEYTFTVSGRAQRTNIDYWILYDTLMNYQHGPRIDIAAVNSPEFWPVPVSCKTIAAVEMKYAGIEGFDDAKTDNKAGLDILQIPKRLAWAAAQYVYDGEDGKAFISLKSMQETDGESTYKVKVNGVLLGEVTNERIHGTDVPDYTTQSRLVNRDPIVLKKGDVIQVEFNNATNGLVPEGDKTATSRGRWLGLEICLSEGKLY